MAVASCKWLSLSIEGEGPISRQGHSCTVHNDEIYLFGGSTIHQGGNEVLYYNDMYKLSVKSGVATWAWVDQFGEIPLERDGHNLCGVGTSLYLYGGKNELSAEKCLSKVYRFDLDRETWSMVNDDRALSPQTLSHTLSAVGSKLYAFGGIRKARASNKTYCFDVNSNQWSPLKTVGRAPKPRCDHAACVVDRRVYVFGGCGGEKQWLNDLFYLDTSSLEWSEVTVSGLPPQPRAMHSLAAHRHKDLYVFGGEREGGAMCDEVLKFSIGHSKWRKALYTGPLPSARQGHTANIIHSTMYVIGGLSEEEDDKQVHALKLINPSERQPVLKPLMQENGIRSKSLEFQPTVAPTLSYDIPTPAYSTPQPKPATKTTERKVRDFSKIRKRAERSIEDGIQELEKNYYQLDVEWSDLQQEKQDLKQREEAYAQMYNKQQRELELKLAEHKTVTESWLRSRQQENDEERKAIAELRCQVTAEYEELRQAQHKLAEREKHIYNVLKQFKDV